MPGIVIFGGTIEGRQLVERLQSTGMQLHICVATEYGASLLPDGENIHVYPGRMDEAEMEQFLLEKKVDYCLDATHPYAAEVTENIANACANTERPYIRIMRKEAGAGQNDFPEKKGKQDNVIFVKDAGEAAEYLCKTTGKIFIATGSKELESYTVIPDYQNRCIARVLPTLPVMEKCKVLDFEGRNLIGMQGPFSEEMNYCMLKQSGAEWMVTKNSGKEGGYPEKCEAALRLGIHIVVIGRPPEPPEHTMGLEEAVALLIEKFATKKDITTGAGESSEEPDAENKRIIYLVAMGPGDDKLLTREAEEALEQSDVLIGAKRMVEIWTRHKEKPCYISYKRDEITEYLRQHPEYKRVALCYSGDIGFYSGAKGMGDFLRENKNIVRPISGISSVTYFLNKLGVSWDETQLVSCHGRESDLAALLKEKKKVCALSGDKNTVSDISKQLLVCGMVHVRMTVGECLSYREERIVTGTPDVFLNREFNSLSVILLEGN